MESVGQMLGYDIDEEIEFDPSLVLYLPLWKLDGNAFKSEDRYGHLCTAYEALWRPDGRLFDGIASDIQVPHHVSQLLTGGLTIIADINPTSIGEVAGRLVYKVTTFPSTGGFTWHFASANILDFGVNGVSNVSSSATVAYGVRQIVAVTCTAAGLATHYRNGIQNGTPGTTGALSGITATTVLFIGNREPAGNRTWDGLIKTILIYNKVMGEVEIRDKSESLMAS